MRKILCTLVVALVVISCSREYPQEQFNNALAVGLRAEIPQTTRTSISNRHLSFKKGDAMLLCCEGVNDGVLSNSNSSSVNSFSGVFHILGIEKDNRNWYSVYPAKNVSSFQNGLIAGTLSTEQSYPFDPSCNFMYSDIVIRDYNEDNLPGDLNMSMNQIMGMIELKFKNTEPFYKDEEILSVNLESSSILTGDFTFNLHEDESKRLSFSTGKNVVSMSYNTPVLLGENTEHVCYLSINPTDIPAGAKIVIRTNRYLFTTTSTNVFSPKAGELLCLNTIDLKNATAKRYGKKRVVCWGDSYTNRGEIRYSDFLQQMLGNEWEVYNGGISGNRTSEIAARQGGMPIFTGSEFTIPATTEEIHIDGILRQYNSRCEQGLFPLRYFGGALANPCIVNGVLCNVFSTLQNGIYSATIQRLTPGEEVFVPEHTSILSYGARMFRDADLTVIYMGANGEYGSDQKEDLTGLDYLILQHKQMIDFLINNENYLVLGFHNRGAKFEDAGYTDKMENAFNSNITGNRFLHLRRTLNSDIKRYLVASGYYNSIDDVPEKYCDKAKADEIWPDILWCDIETMDTHPNMYAAKLIAFMIYERMGQLGYLHN